jgi:hypothetical protein
MAFLFRVFSGSSAPFLWVREFAGARISFRFRKDYLHRGNNGTTTTTRRHEIV